MPYFYVSKCLQKKAMLADGYLAEIVLCKYKNQSLMIFNG
jgi:hypothetical protein